MKIEFYSSGEIPFGSFSNFLKKHPITVKGKEWPSSEHYYQAMKFEGTEHEEAVRLVKTPREAADMGRERSRPLRTDWDQVKDDVMREAIKAKFTQHTCLKSILLASGDAEIIEHTVNDNYWADAGDGSGKNMLGKLLMELRDQLRKEAKPVFTLEKFIQ